jgi:type II secretory pathway component GspD/PulD (secretin)
VCYAACQGVDPDNPTARISLKIKNKKSNKVTAELRRASGRNVVFESRGKNDRFTFEFNNHPVWDVLDRLSKRGKLLLDGTPFDRMKELRHKLSSGEKVSVNFTDIPVRNAVAKLSFLSGLPFRVESGDAGRLLSVSLDEVTLDEMVARISAESGVKIERAQGRASTR